jgi:hypothetical protein
MKVTQLLFKNQELVINGKDEIQDPLNAHLILGFGSKTFVADGLLNNLLKDRYPSAEIVLCSTAGEIAYNSVYDESAVITVISFEKTTIKTTSLNLDDFKDSFELGKSLIQHFDSNGLTSILILSDGLLVNGSQLVSGMEESNNGKVLITGGLAGDGIQFDNTLVSLNGKSSIGAVAAIGFYGSQIDVRSSSVSGWDVFGPERIVTKAKGTDLFEIDNRSAVELYKIYLGPYIDDKTNSTLLFPLAVKLPGRSHFIARSILSISFERNCMIFSGDIPEGSTVRFMKANFAKLIDAADEAAKEISGGDASYSPELALLISCVGRRIILGKQVEEEVGVISDYFTDKTAIVGFYSYGEISPQMNVGPCQLHNQTMTITTFNEF